MSDAIRNVELKFNITPGSVAGLEAFDKAALSIDKSFTGVNSTVTTVTTSISNMKSELSSLVGEASKLSDLKLTFTGVGDGAGGAKEEIGKLAGEIAKVGEGVDTISKSVGRMSSVVDEVKKGIDDVKKVAEDLKAVNSVSAVVDEVKKGVADVKKAIEELKSIGNIAPAIDGVTTAIDEMKSSAVEAKAEVDGMVSPDVAERGRQAIEKINGQIVDLMRNYEETIRAIEGDDSLSNEGKYMAALDTVRKYKEDLMRLAEEKLSIEQKITEEAAKQAEATEHGRQAIEKINGQIVEVMRAYEETMNAIQNDGSLSNEGKYVAALDTVRKYKEDLLRLAEEKLKVEQAITGETTKQASASGGGGGGGGVGGGGAAAAAVVAETNEASKAVGDLYEKLDDSKRAVFTSAIGSAIKLTGAIKAVGTNALDPLLKTFAKFNMVSGAFNSVTTTVDKAQGSLEKMVEAGKAASEALSKGGLDAEATKAAQSMEKWGKSAGKVNGIISKAAPLLRVAALSVGAIVTAYEVADMIIGKAHQKQVKGIERELELQELKISKLQSEASLKQSIVEMAANQAAAELDIYNARLKAYEIDEKERQRLEAEKTKAQQEASEQKTGKGIADVAKNQEAEYKQAVAEQQVVDLERSEEDRKRRFNEGALSWSTGLYRASGLGVDNDVLEINRKKEDEKRSAIMARHNAAATTAGHVQSKIDSGDYEGATRYVTESKMSSEDKEQMISVIQSSVQDQIGIQNSARGDKERDKSQIEASIAKDRARERSAKSELDEAKAKESALFMAGENRKLKGDDTFDTQINNAGNRHSQAEALTAISPYIEDSQKKMIEGILQDGGDARKEMRAAMADAREVDSEQADYDNTAKSVKEAVDKKNSAIATIEEGIREINAALERLDKLFKGVRQATSEE